MLNSTLTTISILISVAFFTLLERKTMSYIQLRKGPNKVGPFGLLQPFSDAIKLFHKPLTLTSNMNSTKTILSPPILLMITLLMWPLSPIQNPSILDNHFNLLSIILMLSLSIYPLLATGWATNSKYSNLGTLRNIAQMISYEVALFFIFLNIILMTHSFSMHNFFKFNNIIWFLPGMALLNLIWMVSCLSETNRSPFDFAEGESELVSGFNIEYAGGPFALIFLAEYTSMIFLSFMTTSLFSPIYTHLSFLYFMTMNVFFLWTRSTLPRFRFDMLMSLNWKIFLPITLSMLMPLSLFSMHHF